MAAPASPASTTCGGRARRRWWCSWTPTTRTTRTSCPALVAPILADEADLAIGSRVLGRRERGALLPQARAGNLVACLLIRLLYGHRFTDLGPFRAVRWQALERLGMSDPDFGWTAEMQVKALREGLRCAEVPVSYRHRVGVSKITGTLSGTVRAGYKILWTVARHARSKRPL